MQKLQKEQKNLVQVKWKEHLTNLEDLKFRHQDELKSLETEIRKLHMENSKLQHKVEVLVSEKAGTVEKYDKVQRILMDQKERNQIHSKELLTRIVNAETRCEHEMCRRINVELQLKNASQEMAGCIESESILRSQLRERQTEFDEEFKSLRAQNEDLQQNLKDAKSNVEYLCSVLDEKKKEVQKRLEDALHTHDTAIAALNRELEEARDLATESVIVLREECKRKQQSLGTLRGNARNTLDCVERKLREERESSKVIMNAVSICLPFSKKCSTDLFSYISTFTAFDVNQ